jgi:hypothetical protein
MLNKELERERLVTCCLEIFVVCSLLFLTTFGLSPLAVAGAFMGSYDKSYLALIIQPKGSKSRENLFKVVIPNIYNQLRLAWLLKSSRTNIHFEPIPNTNITKSLQTATSCCHCCHSPVPG